MPPTFVYFIALIAYFGFACAVWSFAFFLAFTPKTRHLAGKIAAGMAGSFPGVIFFQFLAVPIVAIIFLLMIGLSKLFGTEGTAITIVQLFLAALIFAFVLIMSLFGFYVGWRLAWSSVAGLSVRECLFTDRLMKPIATKMLLRKLKT